MTVSEVKAFPCNLNERSFFSLVSECINMSSPLKWSIDLIKNTNQFSNIFCMYKIN